MKIQIDKLRDVYEKATGRFAIDRVYDHWNNEYVEWLESLCVELMNETEEDEEEDEEEIYEDGKDNNYHKSLLESLLEHECKTLSQGDDGHYIICGAKMFIDINY